jgi:hypothetical protein
LRIGISGPHGDNGFCNIRLDLLKGDSRQLAACHRERCLEGQETPS